ncbi:MAG: cupin domain-containing protein [Thermoguttaceae bacterium]|nr:cupin domain-containing protein [Thermoguttaceae bacterium]
MDPFGVGDPNEGYAKYFVGRSFLKPLTEYGKCPVFLANVSFEPGCRNNWHVHRAKKGGGQILVCTAGEGWYQEEGKPAVSLEPGKVVTIPANVKHWHGAKKDSWFSHIAVECPGEETVNEWLEPVSDKDYSEL